MYSLHWQTFQHILRLYCLVYSSKGCCQQQDVLHSPAVFADPAAVLRDPGMMAAVHCDLAGTLSGLVGILLHSVCEFHLLAWLYTDRKGKLLNKFVFQFPFTDAFFKEEKCFSIIAYLELTRTNH